MSVTIRTKRTICIILAWAAFFLMLCVVDGMDRFVISPGKGALLALALIAVWAAGLWKAGWMRT